MSRKTALFRQLSEAPEILIQPNMYDGCSARRMTGAAIQGMRNALSVLQQSATEGHVIERLDRAVSFLEINDLIGLATIRAMEQGFLTTQQLPVKYGDPAQAVA